MRSGSFRGVLMAAAGLFVCSTLIGIADAPDNDQLPADALKSAHALSGNNASVKSRGLRNRLGQGHANTGSTSFETLPNWNGHFQANGLDGSGLSQVIWYYNMIGNRPELGGTTTVNAPIIPVVVDLRNFDGSPRFVNGHPLIYDPTPFVQPVLNSPVFQNASYSSSPVPTQFADAVQRAEFAKSAKSDWHTMLNPSVKTTRTITLIRGTYQFALNPDGTCCRFILVDENAFINALFPATADDTTTPIGAAENAGEMTLHDLTTLLLPNTFLWEGTPSNCCVLGFHAFDFEPGNIGFGKAYVMNYASWISPGLFGAGFTDVTALSHEISEAFNDPLVAADGVNNITPWWLAPNGQCQNDLETGDVIEGLPNATFPMLMNGFLYHPQNEALLPWFAFDSSPSSLGGAYSYPNTSVLTSLSAPQGVGCQ
jgi:hypothetical protein